MQVKLPLPEDDPLNDLLRVLKDLPELWDQLFDPLEEPLLSVAAIFDDLDRSTPRLRIDVAPFLASEVLNPLLPEVFVALDVSAVLLPLGSTRETCLLTGSLT